MTNYNVNSSQKNFDSKDMIIQRLKEEIFEFKQNEQDFRSLAKQLKELEFRYDQLQREKIKNE